MLLLSRGTWGLESLGINQILLYGPISIPRFPVFPDDNYLSHMKSGEADNSIDFVIWQLVEKILSLLFSLVVQLIKNSFSSVIERIQLFKKVVS